MSNENHKRIVFVCVENANRSQMAEAFARIHGAGKVEAYSAGSRPSGKVNPKAVAAMKEVGCDLGQHRSKALADLAGLEFDVVVTGERDIASEIDFGVSDRCGYEPRREMLSVRPASA